MSNKVTEGYWFTDEYGNEVTVMEVKGNTCYVSSVDADGIYELPLEFVQAIKDAGDEQ